MQKDSSQGTEEEAKETYFGYRKQQGLTEDYRYYFEKVALPDEMANVAIFLASDLATAINGQNIAADYGLTEGASAHECLGGMPAVTPLEL
jgi:NAD(P)-dependent dehydrogenase (short-subunit alcohol dehydrogenase family)